MGKRQFTFFKSLREVMIKYGMWGHSFYTKPELLVGVIPFGDVEADEAGQEGDDLVAGDF